MKKFRIGIVYKTDNDTLVLTDFAEMFGEPIHYPTYLWGIVRTWIHHAVEGTTQPAPLDYPITQAPTVGDYIVVSDEDNNRIWYRLESIGKRYTDLSYHISREDPDLAKAFNIPTG